MVPLVTELDRFPGWVDEQESQKRDSGVESRHGEPPGDPPDHGETGPEIDRKPDEEGEPTRIALSEMLGGEDDHRLVKHYHIINAGFLGTFTFEVDDGGVRKVVVPVAGQRNPVGEVDIFTVHKECFIEISDLVQYGGADEHKSSR